MRDRLHGYSPAELDRLIWRVFSEWPDEAFVARQLGLHVRDVSASLERFATRVAVLADQHWRARILSQIDGLARLCRPAWRSSRIRRTWPSRCACASAALRQSFLAASETPTPAAAPMPAPAVAAVAARQPPARRVRRLEFRRGSHAHARARCRRIDGREPLRFRGAAKSATEGASSHSTTCFPF